MTHKFFFGYGSLVNRMTHGFDPAHRARARGWRRAWRWAEGRQVSFLTVVPDPQSEIEGLVAAVPDDDWGALDLREAAYDRLTANDHVTHEVGRDIHVAIYAIPAANLRHPDAEHPVLLSYVDVVVQGYLKEYGPDGAERFFSSTAGWEAPILDDRPNPRYPRAQRLSDQERAVVDDGLSRLGCRVIA